MPLGLGLLGQAAAIGRAAALATRWGAYLHFPYRMLAGDNSGRLSAFGTRSVRSQIAARRLTATEMVTPLTAKNGDFFSQ